MFKFLRACICPHFYLAYYFFCETKICTRIVAYDDQVAFSEQASSAGGKHTRRRTSHGRSGGRFFFNGY
jgi:hypothetical protein